MTESLVPPIAPGLLFVRAVQACGDVSWTLSKQALSLYLFFRSPSSFSQLVIAFLNMCQMAGFFVWLVGVFCSPGKACYSSAQADKGKPFILTRDGKLVKTDKESI